MPLYILLADDIKNKGETQIREAKHQQELAYTKFKENNKEDVSIELADETYEYKIRPFNAKMFTKNKLSNTYTNLYALITDGYKVHIISDNKDNLTKFRDDYDRILKKHKRKRSVSPSQPLSAMPMTLLDKWKLESETINPHMKEAMMKLYKKPSPSASPPHKKTKASGVAKKRKTMAKKRKTMAKKRKTMAKKRKTMAKKRKTMAKKRRNH